MTDQTARAYRPSGYTDEDDECPELSDGDSALISIKKHDVPSFARLYEVIWFSTNDYIMLFTFQACAHDAQ